MAAFFRQPAALAHQKGVCRKAHHQRDEAAGSLPDASDPVSGVMTEATVKVHVGQERIVAVAEGNGPVHALDGALRAAIAGGIREGPDARAGPGGRRR